MRPIAFNGARFLRKRAYIYLSKELYTTGRLAARLVAWLPTRKSLLCNDLRRCWSLGCQSGR
jgi:hypothetical protein